MKQYINKIHYSERLNPIDKPVKGFLSFLSLFYLTGVSLRNFLYSKNIIKKQKLNAFVVSVGNLTTGGTGKTPITAEIAGYLSQSRRKKVAVLSRGYGGRLSCENTNIISDGKNVFYTPCLAGDEPYWMAVNTDDVMVVTGKNRINSGQEVIDSYDIDTLVLDDGFQHVKLERDLNILVIDCCKKFGNNLVLPAGPLREPVEQIKRADKIILSNKNPFNKNIKADCEEYARYLTQKYNKPVYLSSFKTAGVYNIRTKRQIQARGKVYAFAGIGQPEFFFTELVQEGFEPVKTREFPDHHFYTEDDLTHIIKEARIAGASDIITTEKDAVKLSVLIDEIKPDIDIYALKLGVCLDLEGLFKDVEV